VLALAGLGGAATLWIGSAPRGPSVDGHALAAELDGRLREAQAGVHSRAGTLADIPRLAAAVSTDAATVRDLTQDELQFRPRPGEIITIGQIPKSGAPTVLLQLPDGSPAIAIDGAGVRIALAGGKLWLTEVATVVPKDRADELKGAVAVTVPVDIASLVARLDGLGAGATLAVGDQKLALGAHPPAGGAETQTVALESDAGRGASLIVPAAHGGDPTVMRVAAAGVALAGLLLAALFGLRGRKPAATTATATGDVSPTGKTELAAAASGKTPQPGAPSPSGAQQIGRFTILRQLGSGGMAEVYLARATGEAGFEKQVALKVMHAQLAKQEEIREHFLDEAKLASRLTHPNIVQIIDLGRSGEDYFIAMEYIDGADLDRLLTDARARGAQVPVKVALAIVRKICDGLHAAHTATDAEGKSLDLVHRDVKSANVFVAKNGAVKVGDFGIAKANQLSRVKKTEVGMVKGTREYMAPEHRLGEAVDRRADLYAVGAIAYEILSGTAVNLDLAMLAQRGRDGWPHLPKLTAVRPELPPELDDVVFKALAYERDARFSDCAALEEAIEAIVNKHGLAAGEKQVAQWCEAELAAEAQAAAAAPAPSKTNLYS
jgi:serine/threonine-protein kinase